MILRLFLAALLILLIFPSKIIAQTTQSGCYLSSPATFAVVPVGDVTPPGTSASKPTYTGSLALNNSGACPRVKSFSNNRGSSTCYIRTGSSTNYTYTAGALYDYERENCPIDDYIWIFAFGISSIAFFAVRKYQLDHSIIPIKNIMLA